MSSPCSPSATSTLRDQYGDLFSKENDPLPEIYGDLDALLNPYQAQSPAPSSAASAASAAASSASEDESYVDESYVPSKSRTRKSSGAPMAVDEPEPAAATAAAPAPAAAAAAADAAADAPAPAPAKAPTRGRRGSAKASKAPAKASAKAPAKAKAATSRVLPKRGRKTSTRAPAGGAAERGWLRYLDEKTVCTLKDKAFECYLSGIWEDKAALKALLDKPGVRVEVLQLSIVRKILWEQFEGLQ